MHVVEFDMQNVAEIFAIWPSDADLAREIGQSYSTVSAWKQRGSIPVAYWRAIIGAARKRRHPEITANLLLKLHNAPKTNDDPIGFDEADAAYDASAGDGEGQTSDDTQPNVPGHFSRFKHLRRNNFATAEDVVAHIRALRDEWDD
jgi:hypothetical protein